MIIITQRTQMLGATLTMVASPSIQGTICLWPMALPSPKGSARRLVMRSQVVQVTPADQGMRHSVGFAQR